MFKIILILIAQAHLEVYKLDAVMYVDDDLLSPTFQTEAACWEVAQRQQKNVAPPDGYHMAWYEPKCIDVTNDK